MPEDSLAAAWRVTFDAIGMPLAVVRENGSLVELNRAGRFLAGLRDSAPIPGRLSGLGPGEPWRSAEELVLRAGAGQRSATIRDPVSGCTWEITAFPTEPVAGDGRLVVLMLRDVTEMVSLQETLVRNQTMAALGQLISGVAHEVRSPIFGISATLDAFEARFGPQPDHERYFDNLRRELARMNDLMRDLVELGRPAMAPKRPESLGSMVEQAVTAVREQAAQRHVVIRMDLTDAERTWLVQVDRRRLVQALSHLLDNAIHQSPAGNDVVVRAAAARRSGTMELTLAVEDSGPGFRLEDLVRIGEPFFTRRSGGTGLGLAIVQRIAEDHGGSLAVTNRPEGGASARITLPLAPEPEDTA
jgi:signal transduction histidine kinase